MKIKRIVEQHAVLFDFALAFTITWGAIWILLGGKVLAGTPIDMTDGIVIFACMLLGPSVAGLFMTAFVDGRSGLRELGKRMRQVRLPVQGAGG